MNNKKKPPIISCMSDVVNKFFDENGECYVSNVIPYIVILFLSFIAPKGYKVIITTSEDLIDDNVELCPNGIIKEKIDNLGNIFFDETFIKKRRKEV